MSDGVTDRQAAEARERERTAELVRAGAVFQQARWMARQERLDDAEGENERLWDQADEIAALKSDRDALSVRLAQAEQKHPTQRIRTMADEHPSLVEILDMMETALENNTGEARRRAQFKNTMLSLVAVARQAANEQLRTARTAPESPTESVLRHIRNRGTAA